MKRSTRLLVAIAVTLILGALAASVWAGPGRQGTVPPPRAYPGRCGREINFGLGTVEAQGGECILNIKLVKKPSKAVGPAYLDWSYLLIYAVNVRAVKGSFDEMEICVPLIPDWEDEVIGETISWYRWDTNMEEWVPVLTTIEERPPTMICGTSNKDGIYSLQGQ